MTQIAIICTANICRSPVVEALLRDRLGKNGYADWQVLSAGTWAIQQRGASQNSVEVLRDLEGLDISAHQAEMVDEALLVESDLILCMERGHAEALKVEFPDQAEKIYLLSQMVDNLFFDIADPIGLSRDHYERMVKEVRGLIEEGLPRIIELAKDRPAG